MVYGLSTILGRLLNVLLVPLYTYQFEPTAYGRVSMVFTLLAFVQVVCLLGLETAFFRETEHSGKPQETLGRTLAMVLPASSLMAVVLLFLAPYWAAHWLDGAQHADLIRWAAVIMWLDALAALPFAYLRQQNKSLRFASIKLTNIGMNVGANLLLLVGLPALFQQQTPPWLVALGYHAEPSVVYIFWANALASGISLALLLPQWHIRWSGLKISYLIPVLRYSLPLVGVGLAAMANETLDRFLLRRWLDGAPETRMAAIGIYSACYKFSIFMTLVVQSFRYAAEPFFFAQAHREDARGTYALIMRMFVVVGGFIVLLVSFSLDLLKWAIDETYHDGIDVVPILLIANLFLGIYYNLSVWYKVSGRTSWGALVAIAGVLITLGANAVSIPWLGFRGAAWATLLCYSGMSVLSLLLSRRFYPIPYALSRIGSYLLVISALTTLGWWIRHHWIGAIDAWSMLALIVLVLSYLLIAYAAEKPIFDHMLKKLFKT